jgi:transcription elongation factor Elf1
MNWLESKYVGLISSRLRNYSKKSGDLYNFSCPFCGDSENNKKKARAYIYTKKDKTMFHCHNCTVTHGFTNFIKLFDFQLYSEFCLERLKSEKTPQQIDLEEFVAKMKTPVFLKSGPLKGLKKISQLSPDHNTKLYVANRKIPNPYHAKMFHCPNFFSWTNELIPGKFDDEVLLYDEPRLLIPFINKEGQMHAFQGRSLDPKSNTKYITIVLDDEKPKIWGLDDVLFSKTTYVFEGVLDAMFIQNSIATAGGDLSSSVTKLPKDKIVIVYDNEPRSIETRKKLDKAIINGYNVCIWPTNLEHKDVNIMILAGLSADFIRYIIDTNTYRDLKAKLALNMWSKV